jgi:hypothetical protein
MNKVLLVGFLLAIATQSLGQGIVVQNSNPTSSIANRGSYIADSIFRIGTRDTVKPSWWNPAWSFNGALQIGLDGKPYYYFGGYWRGVGSGASVTSITQGYGMALSPSPIVSTGSVSVDTTAISTKANVNSLLSAKVPYVGATTNVNLGEFQATVGQVTLDQTPTQAAGVGVLRWNDSDGTADLGLKGGNVTLQIGQEEVVRVVNKTGANLLESQYHAVYVSGAQGQRLKVGNAIALADSSSAATIGLVTENINLNQEGFITTNGLVRDINTTGSLQGETWNDGDLLYLSGTTAGQITNVKPIAPTHTVIIGYVVYAHANNGKIFVKVDNGYELDELHNVRIVSAANNEGLFYDSAAKLWENKSISTVLGYTPANNATVVKYVDTATMLAPYATDAQVALKLNIADTANMRIRPIAGSNMTISGTYPNVTFASTTIPTDSTIFATNYRVDTAKANLRTSINTKLNSTDTASLSDRINLKANIASPTFTGTVTIPTGANITTPNILSLTSGTTTDSLVVANATSGALRRISPSRVGLSGLTTNYVTKATSATAIGNSQIFDNGTSVGINTATPLATTKLHINSTTNASLDGGDLRIDNSTIDAATITLNSTGTFGKRYTVYSSAQAFGAQGSFGVYDHTSAFSSLMNNGSLELGTLAVRGSSVGGASVSINSSAAGGTTWGIISNATASGRAGMLTFWNGAHRIFFTGTGQLGVGAAPNASTILDITSTTQGLGLPSMTTTQKNAIATPRTGLEVYDNALSTPEFYNGSVWTGAWNKRGNAGTTAGTDFIGTTDNVDLVFKRSNATAGWLNAPLFNTSYGVNSLPLTSTGGYATAIGHGALSGGTTGNFNIAIGYNAGTKLSSSASNIAIGRGTLGESGAGHTGNENVAIGEKSMFFTTTATRNAGYGWFAGYNLTTGNNNTFLGGSSGGLTTTGSNNISIGYESVTGTTGSKNLVVGYQGNVPTGTASNQLNIGNVLWGTNCSGTGVTAAGNLSIGSNAPNASALLDLTSTTQGLGLPSMTTTQQNAIATPRAGLAVYNSTLSLPTFYNGTAWSPYFSGWSLTGNAGTSDATNFIGTTDGVDVIFKRANIVSGRLNDAKQVTSFGVGALPTTSTGDGNTAFGWKALNVSTSGGANTALGFWSLRLCTTGFSNAAVGYGVLIVAQQELLLRGALALA